jgi:uncharacterized membrane protein (UPF0136 family)
MAIFLIVYAVVLAILSILLERLTETRSVSVIAGLLGACFCGAWGFASVLVVRGRTWPVLVLIALALIFLAQTVNAWWPVKDLLPPILLSLCLVLTMAILVYLLYGERDPSFWTGRAAPNAAPRRPTST